MKILYKTVAFKTLGCKLNYVETSTLQRSFIKYGYSVVDFDVSADFYVINSYSVTDNTDKKSRKIIHKSLKKYLFEKNIIIGCYAQNYWSKKNTLIESYDNGYLLESSDNYIKVQIKGQVNEINKFIPLQLNYHKNDIIFRERML